MAAHHHLFFIKEMILIKDHNNLLCDVSFQKIIISNDLQSHFLKHQTCC